MTIQYIEQVENISPKMLSGFFQGWPNPPSPAKHLLILQGSFKVWLAIDSGDCVGFINAISDGIFSAFIPLLEVLPEYQGQGIGTELVRLMQSSLAEQYSLDVVCDAEVVPFYEKLGYNRLHAMSKRNYQNCVRNVRKS